jgi:hypothetical protein
MSFRFFRPALTALLGLGLAACAGELGREPSPLAEMKRYYDRYAMEEGGLCRSPQFGLVTASGIEAQGADRLIVRVSYLYSDPSVKPAGYVKYSPGPIRPGIAGPSQCQGSGRRTFTVARRAAGFEVLEMTGSQHKGIKINKIDDSKVW